MSFSVIESFLCFKIKEKQKMSHFDLYAKFHLMFTISEALLVRSILSLGTNFFATKIWKMDQKWTKKQGFLNFWKNLVINFYCICSIMQT